MQPAETLNQSAHESQAPAPSEPLSQLPVANENEPTASDVPDGQPAQAAPHSDQPEQSTLGLNQSLQEAVPDDQPTQTAVQDVQLDRSIGKADQPEQGAVQDTQPPQVALEGSSLGESATQDDPPKHESAQGDQESLNATQAEQPGDASVQEVHSSEPAVRAEPSSQEPVTTMETPHSAAADSTGQSVIEGAPHSEPALSDNQLDNLTPQTTLNGASDAQQPSEAAISQATSADTISPVLASIEEKPSSSQTKDSGASASEPTGVATSQVGVTAEGITDPVTPDEKSTSTVGEVGGEETVAPPVQSVDASLTHTQSPEIVQSQQERGEVTELGQESSPNPAEAHLALTNSTPVPASTPEAITAAPSTPEETTSGPREDSQPVADNVEILPQQALEQIQSATISDPTTTPAPHQDAEQAEASSASSPTVAAQATEVISAGSNTSETTPRAESNALPEVSSAGVQSVTTVGVQDHIASDANLQSLPLRDSVETDPSTIPPAAPAATNSESAEAVPCEGLPRDGTKPRNCSDNLNAPGTDLESSQGATSQDVERSKAER